ncbi:MAG TPA: tetratricopeptide repeat protein, partial [Saprospiraceae bacterium]
MRIIAILFFLSGIVAPKGFAQTNKDSLWNVWNNSSEPDTNRLKAIQRLTWPMLNVNLDSALLLANQQLEFATEKNVRFWIGKAYYNIATCYYYKGDYVRSLNFYQKSLEIRKEFGDKKGEAAIYGNIGLIYAAQGNNLKNLEYQLQSLAINETLQDTDNLTSNYSNIAVIYQEQKDTTKALEYYNRTLRMYEAEGNEKGIAIAYNNMGTMFKEFEQWDKSLHYLHQSLEVRTRLKDIMGMAINYVNLGTVYNQMKNHDKAKEYTLKSIDYFKLLGDSTSLGNSYYTLGDIALDQGQYKEAIKNCELSLDIAVATHRAPVESAACNCLYRAYKALGNTEKALYYFEDFYFLEDSLAEEDLKIALKRL